MQRNRGKLEWGRLEVSSRTLRIPREHAKMGTVRDRNSMDLTEAKDIKKRWQEYIELYKKDLIDPGKPSGMITQLEPYILQC